MDAGAAFVSIFPLVAQSFGLQGPSVWQVSSAAFFAVLVICTAGLVWLLFFSALLFVRLLVNRPGAPSA